jgi:hypothetical protein
MNANRPINRDAARPNPSGTFGPGHGPEPGGHAHALGADVRPMMCPGEGAGAAEASAATAIRAPTTSVALLAGHVLREGELVLLILRPSRWFIMLTSLRFLAGVAVLAGLLWFFDDGSRYRGLRYMEAAAFLSACRIMWAILQWMGRLYILTDLRIIRLSGVFNIEIFDCPLRKVARTHLQRTLKEQLARVGSIVIVPQDEQMPIGTWHMVAHPRTVLEKIRSTIARARQGNGHGQHAA